jgi:hypothetical protein
MVRGPLKRVAAGFLIFRFGQVRRAAAFPVVGPSLGGML